MSTDATVAQTDQKVRKHFWNKRRMVLASVIVIMLFASAAYALFNLRLGVGGNGSISVSPTISFSNASVETRNAVDSCTVTTLNGGNSATIQMLGAYEGSYCDIRWTLAKNGSAAEMKVQGFSWAAPTAEYFLNTGCGRVIPAGGTVDVITRIYVTPGTPAGDFVAEANAGMVAVDLNAFNQANCPVIPAGAPTAFGLPT